MGNRIYIMQRLGSYNHAAAFLTIRSSGSLKQGVMKPLDMEEHPLLSVARRPSDLHLKAESIIRLTAARTNERVNGGGQGMSSKVTKIARKQSGSRDSVETLVARTIQ